MSEETTTEVDEGIQDLDISLVENEDGETPTEEEYVTIGDEEVPWQDVMEAYQNKGEWQKSNTQKAQEIADEKRRLEEDKRSFEQRRQDLEAWERGLYQQRGQTQIVTEQQTTTTLPEDFEDLDPVTKTMYQDLQETKSLLKQQREDWEKNQFIQQTKAEHDRLKSLYPDYEPTNIERLVIQGRNQLEDAYLSEKFKSIKNGDPNSIKSMIPETLMQEIRQEERKKLIEDIRKTDKQRKAISTPTPSREGGLQTIATNKKPKDYTEVNEQALETLRQQGMSLTGD